MPDTRFSWMSLATSSTGTDDPVARSTTRLAPVDDHAVRDIVKPSDGETVLPDKRGHSHRGTAIRERAQPAQQQDPRCVAPNAGAVSSALFLGDYYRDP
jgi:hypothetical protein